MTHDARHTADTRTLQVGRDVATIGSITGHKDQTSSAESLDKAIDVLETFCLKWNALGLDSAD